MMKAQFLLLLPWAAMLLAGPARRDCGETKSFVGTNSCGKTYGGTWIECATARTALPTFLVPTCAPTPTAAITIWGDRIGRYKANATVIAPPASLITAAPAYKATALPVWDNLTTSCSPLFICIDCLAVCGGKSRKYGDCYDTCTPHSISSPECTLPSALPTAPPRFSPNISTTSMQYDYNLTVPSLGIYKAPLREEKSWCLGASFMCAPRGWFR
ncbi:hypothetical protein T440DRAFT_541798 [Plenodomus tracheiphilus IPT5]|uniref:Carbohydrate-binding module family 52 protein n=1 Tax=Plenodomus tracheiphilus IPT5 TaxID=1408161 RepID=A0A6A7BGE9_9PLEO|nr:hypothetical protein T440DRAFT_541798 [Plenodomus tracheiphilus IPT5]